MASGPITSWQIDGETVETVSHFISWGSKITANGDCSHEIKTLTPWKESYDQPRQHIQKQRHYFANKGPSSQRYGFSSSMDGCDSWTIKKAEHQRIDAFELWCWRRLLRVPWTSRRSNQSTLKEISPGYSLEGLMLKLKLQYFSHLMWITDSLKKTRMLGKTEERRKRGWQRMRQLIAPLTQRTWIWANSGRQWRTGKPGVLQSMGCKSRTWLRDWTTTTIWPPKMLH